MPTAAYGYIQSSPQCKVRPELQGAISQRTPRGMVQSLNVKATSGETRGNRCSDAP